VLVLVGVGARVGVDEGWGVEVAVEEVTSGATDVPVNVGIPVAVAVGVMVTNCGGDVRVAVGLTKTGIVGVGTKVTMIPDVAVGRE
jgi:hypothetical protein